MQNLRKSLFLRQILPVALSMLAVYLHQGIKHIRMILKERRHLFMMGFKEQPQIFVVGLLLINLADTLINFLRQFIGGIEVAFLIFIQGFKKIRFYHA